jgi:hypothetical protein
VYSGCFFDGVDENLIDPDIVYQLLVGTIPSDHHPYPESRFTVVV